MKKILLTGILLSLITPDLQAQYFTVKEFSMADPVDGTSVFPEMIAPDSKSALPELAAERINYFLKYDVLMKVHGNEGENIFSEVFPPEDEIGGEAEFSYDFYCNNARFLSLWINNSFTGAYTEYMDRNYVFNAYTGEHLTLADFFDLEQYQSLTQKTAKACASIIYDYLNTIDPEDEYGEDKRMMYEDCLSNFEGDGQPFFGFYLTDTTMVLTYGRCSNHMMAALDDLWDFQVPYTFEELKPYLSDEGRSVLFNEGRQSSTDLHLPDRKVLSGTLDGKYPVHAIFSGLAGQYLNGVYWYDNYKKPISIYGTRLEDGTMELWEEVKGEKYARIELIYQNGQLMGVWERVDGSSSFPIDLRID